MADAVALKVEESAGVYHIQGEFAAPVSFAMAWNVLTDYDHLGDFLKSLRRSEVERRADGGLVLRQEASVGRFPFRRTVHVALELHDETIGRIGFHDILGRDFVSYAGEWRVLPDSARTVVRYVLEARPCTSVPHMFVRGALGRGVHDLLLQVRSEMERRAAAHAGQATRAAGVVSEPPRPVGGEP